MVSRVSLFSMCAAGVLLFSACQPTQRSPIDTVPQPPEERGDETSTTPAADNAESVTAPVGAAAAVPVEMRTVRVDADNWSFTPTTLRLKKGQDVTVQLVGKAGIHSFTATDLGINQAISPGKTVNVKIPTEKTGTFEFRCAIPCGEGHKAMKGQIIIE